VWAGCNILGSTVERLVDFDWRGGDRDRAPVRHGIPRVDHEVQQHLLDLASIDPDEALAGRVLDHQPDVFPDEPPKHRAEPVHHQRQLQHLRREDLLAAVGEQLPGQGRGPLRRPGDLLSVLMGRAA